MGLLDMFNSVSKDTQISMKKGEDLFFKGIRAAQNEDFEEAIKYYTKSIQYNNGASGVYVNRGFANHKLRKYQDAVIDYKKAIELEKEDPTGNLNAAQDNLNILNELGYF